MSRPHFRKFNNQDWEARKAEKQKQWEQRQAEKAKRQAEWEARRAARKAEIEARRKAQQELAAARKAERAKRKAEREKEIAKKRAEIAQRKRERLERQKRELERLSNKSETFTKRVSFTAINDGKPYLVDEDARLLYGIRDAAGDVQHAEGEVVFENATNPQELLRLGKQKLKEVSKPQVSYEAEVVSLGRAGFDPDGVGIGDAVQIIDTTFTPPIRVEGRVLKIEEDLLDSVDATRITLGNIHESYTQKRRAQEQKLDELIAQSSEWNAVAEGNGLYVRDLIGRMNEIMNGVGGYVYLKPGIGIIIYDKPENQHPTRAIQLGGGYWRTANSRKSNGDWDWKNIASGEGIFANAITTGRLMDAQGRNWWNMDTGEFSLQSSTRIGGRTVKEIADDSAKDAAEVLRDRLDSELTQRAIFNKLTNNGEAQGMWLNGGQLYVNASYLSAGIISDKTGNNKWNLDAGYFKTTVGEIGDFKLANGSLKSDFVELNPSFLIFYDIFGGEICRIGCESKTNDKGETADGLFFSLHSENQWFDIRSANDKMLANGSEYGWTFCGNTSLDELYVKGDVLLGKEATFSCNNIFCTGRISCDWLDEKFEKEYNYFNEHINDLQGQINTITQTLNSWRRG